MNSTEKLLVDIIRNELSHNIIFECPSLTPEAAEELCKEAMVQSVSMFVAAAISPQVTSVYPKFQQRVLRSLSSNCAITYEHANVGKLLSDAQIPYCILKGCASAYYYPNADMRSLGDVDFLVRPCDKERACKVLLDNGFALTKNADEHDFHLAFHHNRIASELHFCIGSLSETPIDLNKFTDDIINTAHSYHTDYGDIMIPDAYHHAVIMLFHVYRHFVNNGIGLRHLVDWAVFAASEDFDKIADRLLSDAAEWGLYNFTVMLCQVSSIYLGIPWKKTFGTKNKSLAAAFIEDILRTGNFGKKETGSYSILFVEKNLKQKSNSLYKNFFEQLKALVCRHWPKAENNTFIMGVGLVVFSIRHIIFMISGKRQKMHFLKDYEKAKARAELNKNLSDK